MQINIHAEQQQHHNRAVQSPYHGNGSKSGRVESETGQNFEGKHYNLSSLLHS
jgi:hypothetical protein